MRKSREPEDLLPLTTPMLHVLLALADGDRHGHAIIKEVSRRTDGQVTLGADTLYALITRLLDEEMILESGERPDAALDDERHRYYRLTPFGGEVAQAEVRRLESLIAQARTRQLFCPTTKRGRP